MSTCKISVDDGTNVVIIEGVPEQNVAYAPIAGGGSILRFLDGSAAKQQRWYKEQITISGEDRSPQGLRQLLFDQRLTLTIVTSLGMDVYTGYSLGVSETWGLTSGKANWSMVFEED